MFNILIISTISSIILSFFTYLIDSIDNNEEELDLNKYIKYFFLNFLVFSISLYLFTLFFKNDIDSMSLNVDIPNF